MSAGDCGKLLLLQAELDGELDAAQAAALAEHRAGCPVCKRNEAALSAAREASRAATYHRADPQLLRAVAARIGADHSDADRSGADHGSADRSGEGRSGAGRNGSDRNGSDRNGSDRNESDRNESDPNGSDRNESGRNGSDRVGAARRPPRRRGPIPLPALASFGAGAALAAALILAFLPASRPGLVGALVDDHVRALQPGHLLDVVSTNQHTVKPWFDGRLDFAPPVKDLAAAGFPLVGGRLDYLGGRSVAVLIYSHGKHVVELFVWPQSAAGREPARAARDGYNIVHWTAAGMSFSAVSDLDPAGLEDFAREWRQTS